MEVEEQIIEILDKRFHEAGNEDLFLVDLRCDLSGKKLEVYIESDKELNIDRCASINRFLQKILDEKGWFGEKYTLDVSSPGVGKPLKLFRQYRKNVGRKLEIFRKENKPVSGILKSLDEKSIVIETVKGKGKKRTVEQLEISFEEILKAVVKISF